MMNLSRRQFVATLAATAIVPRSGQAGTSDAAVLEPRAASLRLAPEQYPETKIWGYNGTAPGPTIRVPQGGRVTRLLKNSLPQDTAIHWHGIRLDNSMDGVPGLTQDAVVPNATFLYDFEVPDAGTYWYHSHNQSVEQVDRGLYGALIVDEAEKPDVDREEVIILDDWLLTQDAQIDSDFGNMHSRSHAGRMGNFITSNGRYDLSLGTKRFERLRLRLINAATARSFALQLDGLEGWVVAYDGMPLDTIEPAKDMLIGPAQRVDLIVDVTAEAGQTAQLIRLESDGAFIQVDFPVTGSAAVSRRAAPTPLPPNPTPILGSLDGAKSAKLIMEGGAMGRLQAAVYNGDRMTPNDLMQQNMFWSFNGGVGMTDTPSIEVSKGETVRIPITNDTVFAHAMHMHGNHFREVLPDGGFGPLRDTLMVMRGETREIAFVADNPGDWLFHCHMLSHQEAGMRTWVKIT